MPSLLPRYCYIDKNSDYRACSFLAGSGRGGTTWLADLINYDNSYRFMFEPFYNARVKEFQAFADQQYLRPNNEDKIFLSPARNVFTGRIRNRWVDSHNRKLRIEKRLVKDIRANLLIGWIKTHFPNMPVVLVLRHPCAVAHSRCMNRWMPKLEEVFFSQPTLVEDYLSPFRAFLPNLQTDFERHVFSWCIETYVPLKQICNDDALVTTYEDCVSSPRSEIRRIFDFLGRPFTDDVLSVVSKPSTQARYNKRSNNASAIVLGESIIDSWVRSVKVESVERTLEIIQLFGLDCIYGAEPMPKPGGIHDFTRANSFSRAKTAL